MFEIMKRDRTFSSTGTSTIGQPILLVLNEHTTQAVTVYPVELQEEEEEGGTKELNMGFVRLLLQCLVHVSASYSSNYYMVADVGNETVLHCNWTSRVGTAQRSRSPHLWWGTPEKSVYELKGNDHFEAPDYKGRVEVELESFKAGDCSLLLRDVRFSDARLYESYVSEGKGRRFIRSVELSVKDHKYRETVAAGKSLQLKLHTTQAATVVFVGNEVAGAVVVWQRGGGGSGQGGRLSEGEKELTLSDVKLEDSGTYKVLDPQGQVVSTVDVTVEEVLPKQSVPESTVDQRYMEDARDAQSSAFRASGASLITGSLLLFSLHLLF
ncbi:hypothetical protein SKAU_G00057840 [Synaphobranchus kaupii]|uniref:Immunoglobulin domain-containing protein n=1 Tax=Synaphobranchus kaupii TaxID=118154 RepID=A0A9Q1G5D0_SYNKA|nr:hypothetical protein SKAU_G00057840 [Synaphobranchus kaupii]